MLLANVRQGSTSIELSHFAPGTASQRADFVQCLVDSLAEHGVFRLINLGISEASIQELFLKVSSFSVYNVTRELTGYGP